MKNLPQKEVGAQAGRCLRTTDGQRAAGGDALERELGALMAALAETFQKRAGELHGELSGAWEGVTLSVARTLATH